MAYNVLIVDDSASMRSIIAKALRLSGVPLGEVHMAGDGHEALAALDSQWIDIVLADLNMPRMGGIELVERMKDQGITARVPVVVISTESRQEVIHALLAMGATAFLRKPFAPERLGTLIESILTAEVAPPAETLLTTSFFEALEGFAMLVGDLPAEKPAAPANALLATVAFMGPGTCGEVTIAACPSVCADIARTATGEDDGDGADALAELANMTAGQVIERLVGGPFALHPPVRSDSDGATAWARIAAAGASSVFDVEGHPVAASVDVRKRW